jgi:hypothetical protein
MVFSRPRLSRRASAAVSAGLRSSISSETIAAFVRWSQLETWLRQLVHLELSAAYGRKWIDALAPKLSNRAANDAANSYMLSPDDESLLSYSDMSDLFRLIEHPDHWPLFESSLLPLIRWRGLTDELRAIRNRIAHCRKPHHDDVARIELLLRNLEPGAKMALQSYYESIDNLDPSDTIAKTWLGKQPPWAHIRDHAERKYDTMFRMRFSRRPWGDGTTAIGTKGVLVHARWHIRDGYVFPHAVWPDLLDRGFDPQLIVHYVQDISTRVDIVFAAVDPHNEIADAIEGAFQAVLGGVQKYGEDDAYFKWADRAFELGPRCHVDDAFAHSDRLSLFSVFNANSPKRTT